METVAQPGIDSCKRLILGWAGWPHAANVKLHSLPIYPNTPKNLLNQVLKGLAHLGIDLPPFSQRSLMTLVYVEEQQVC